MTLELYCVNSDGDHIPVKVTSPTTLLHSQSDAVIAIAKPSGDLIVPEKSTTGTIAEIWDEFNRTLNGEIVWDGAIPTEGTASVGLLPRG